MVTQKDFVAIAAILKKEMLKKSYTSRERMVIHDLRVELADYFFECNPRFDIGLFTSAATEGLTERQIEEGIRDSNGGVI